MTVSRTLKIALPLAAVLGAGAAVAIAAIPGADGTIRACYATSGTPTGAVRIVDEGQNCANGEQLLTWNQTGPTGPAGPPGPQGDPGTSGGTDTGGGGFGTDTGYAAQPGGPSADIFLKLDGIPGESTDDKHTGEIDVEAVAYGVKRSGKSRVATVRIDKVYDSSSPKLLAASATGHHLKSAVITFRLSGAPSDSAYLTYRLSDVVVSSYEQGGANPDDKPLGSLEEEVGLTAAKLQVTERSVDSSGKQGPPITANVDLHHLKH